MHFCCRSPSGFIMTALATQYTPSSPPTVCSCTSPHLACPRTLSPDLTGSCMTHGLGLPVLAPRTPLHEFSFLRPCLRCSPCPTSPITISQGIPDEHSLSALHLILLLQIDFILLSTSPSQLCWRGERPSTSVKYPSLSLSLSRWSCGTGW